jgi:hypothetical protein
MLEDNLAGLYTVCTYIAYYICTVRRPRSKAFAEPKC